MEFGLDDGCRRRAGVAAWREVAGTEGGCKGEAKRSSNVKIVQNINTGLRELWLCCVIDTLVAADVGITVQ